ncbi:MAG: hypothetical protein Tsb0019_09040 [Roseibium sp.]
MSFSRSVLIFCLTVPVFSPLATLGAETGPITGITLSSGGLAEVVRRADVDSSGVIRMSVPLDQVNDILKSIVVFDADGVVEGITLPGPNPLAETFRNLPFTQEDLQSPARLLAALQGARVRLDTAGSSVEGLVLGVAARDRGNSGESLVASVLSDGRIVGVELAAGTEIAFLDEDIQRQVTRALAVVGSGKADGARTVTLKVRGAGTREVAVSYVVPAPIWKTAYRVVTLSGDRARLQAWAVLENASGEDWDEVTVTLSSGAPVTLRQRLHDLYWKQRREVPVDVSQGYVPRPDTGAEPQFDVAESEARPERRAMIAGLAAPEAAPAPFPREIAAASVGEASEGTVTATFALPAPVSLASGDTLSVPIVDTEVRAESVSVFQPESGLAHPVAAILIDNQTGTSLPKGILTVYDESEGYVGDAQIGGLPAGESRMASFATDRKVMIAQKGSGDSRIVSVKVADGVLTATVRETSRTDYAVRGAPDGDRTVIIEHARRAGWDFTSDRLMDATARHHRLRLEVAAGKSETVSALHERTLSQSYALISTDANELQYLAGRTPDPATAEKLRALAELQTEIAGIERRIRELDEQKSREAGDQERHRANLAATGPGSDLYKRAARKLEESETRIETVEAEVAALRERQREVRAALGDAIRSF